MASLPGSGSWSVEQLLEAVDRLSPAEQREFRRRLAARQAVNGGPGSDEAALIRAARARLPAAAERRLRRLIVRSKRGQRATGEEWRPATKAQWMFSAKEGRRRGHLIPEVASGE
jgi:hypothetical protein